MNDEKAYLKQKVKSMRDSGVLPSEIMKRLHITYRLYKSLYESKNETTDYLVYLKNK